MEKYQDFKITERGKNRLKKLGEKYWNGERLNRDEIILLPLFTIYTADNKESYVRALLDESVVELKKLFPFGVDDPYVYVRAGYIECV